MSGFQAHGGVILPHFLVTPLRPDLFSVDDERWMLVVFELTCHFERNIDREHTYKEVKYAPLVSDLARSFKVFHYSAEIAALGFV